MMAALTAGLIASEFHKQTRDLRAPLEIGPVTGAPLEIDGRPPAPVAAPPPAPPPRASAPGRIEFEMRTNQSRYLTPEIAFGVSRTDEARQRVSAWLRFASNQQTLWLEDQSALHPLLVDSPLGTIKIVFTTVTHDRVAGYLLPPS
jgi:hypothetical protein